MQVWFTSQHLTLITSLSKLFLSLDYKHYPKPFRFLDAWSQYPSSEQTIKEAWSLNEYGVRHISLTRKLRNTAKALTIWNMNVFGFCTSRIQNLEQQVNLFKEVILPPPTSPWQRKLNSYLMDG